MPLTESEELELLELERQKHSAGAGLQGGLTNSSTQSQTSSKQPPNTLYGIAEALMPASAKAKASGTNQSTMGNIINFAKDIGSLSSRTMGAVRKKVTDNAPILETMKDENETLFRPVIDQLKNKPLPENSVLKDSPLGSKGARDMALELAGGIAGDPTSLLGSSLPSKAVKAGRKVLSGGESLLTKTASTLSGISPEALRAYGLGTGKQAKDIRNLAGKKVEKAKELLNIVNNFEDHIPEKDIIANALNNMPDIDMKGVYEAMDLAKAKQLSPPAISANRRVGELKNIYKNYSTKKGTAIISDGALPQKTEEALTPISSGYTPLASPNRIALPGPNLPTKQTKTYLPAEYEGAVKSGMARGRNIGTATFRSEEKIPAKDFIEARRQLDAMIKSVYSKDPAEASIFERQGEAVRSAMKKALEEAAIKSGNPEYIQAMKAYGEKLDALDKIKSLLGYNESSRENRALNFVDRLAGKNSEFRNETMQGIDKIAGSNIANQAKNIKYASEFGEGGKPGLFPAGPFTGGRLLGPLAAMGVGGLGAGAESLPAILAALGTAGLSTPIGATKAVGAANAGLNLYDIISQLGKQGYSPLKKSLQPVKGKFGLVGGITQGLNKDEEEE